MRRAVVTMVGALLALLGAGLAYPSPAGALEPPQCYVRADAPHISSTAGVGIIAKINFECINGGSQKYTEVLMNLYKCASQPSGPESGWGQYGCQVVKSAHYFDDFTATSSSPKTRYVPKDGEPGARGSGWWIQCTQYVRAGATSQRTASIARQITYNP